ncbi:hypothetical protein AK812_SmicGene39120 [Symbiodinium microadriaticum]|uniref:Uncharacterized protein n=1 Tax=Symbiodinium microadriaticum TaxID=2951 RepID=A0A1Q9CC10_SYMMI|nr:hypothetical protein AK812_SmicGene39120 [Symbiodinium microadriaticum]CAE7703677.1 unnamed protein product [Symbiodinium microadriaticum]CAE7878800.1 unnamed protein product [Symbiodinium sp. KB8]
MARSQGRASISLLVVAFVSSILPLHVQPWKIAAWNQHRKSSYFQKDCVWVSTLQRMGYHKQDIVDAIGDLKVRYSPGELQRWASGYDIIAIQEADPLFCEALGTLSLRMLRGQNDLDGRGVQVESCSALILRNAECVCQQSAVLSFKPFGRRVTVSREHFVVRVERPNDGEQLVICSVHLHVPSMISRSRITLADYLQPLRDALESVAGKGGDGRLEVPCLLLGDFNMDPSMFNQLAHDDPFWQQFQSIVPEGGATAHSSNPSMQGDFAVTTAGEWQGKAMGSPSFQIFERYAAQVSQALCERIHLKDAHRRCQEARRGLGEMEASVSHAAEDVVRLRCLQTEAPQALRDSLHAVRAARLRLLSAEHCLDHSLRRNVPLRRSLLNSDHRPLSFEGVLSKD